MIGHTILVRSNATFSDSKPMANEGLCQAGIRTVLLVDETTRWS